MIGSGPTSAVVVCAFSERRWRHLVAALDSLAAQSHPPDEIVVVIDHNAALEARASAGLPAARVIANRHVPGLSGARNTGVQETSGEVVAFMDDDAVADRDWLQTLLDLYRDPRVIGVGGAVMPHWEQGRPRSFPEEFDWVVGCTYRGMPTRRRPVRNLIGANMSFRREVVRVAGGFCDGIGRVGGRAAGCEETDLCIRALAAFPAGVILYEPAAVVLHRVPAARASWLYFGTRCYREGLSKAQVTQRAGIGRGLSCERAHAARTIPLGVLHGLRSALSGDWAGLARAAALVVGLWITTVGFVVGRARRPSTGPA
ncbi:MAG: glycosyltransferase family 2 protein [Solirubrobacterales bacterium]|nr:glycosyltransferase family 2 protein [Solirubrobacterales bacterium]